MANLPDLDTSQIALTGFWDVNATITQADLNNIIANLYSHTLYDNGVDGTVRVSIAGAIDNLNGRYLFNVRVRTDGVILVWSLRASDPDLVGGATAVQRQASGIGYAATRGSVLPTTSTGVRAGSVTLWALLCDALENLMTTTQFKTVVVTTNVGHYDFQYPTMTKIYILGEERLSAGSESFTFTQPSSGNGVLMAVFHVEHAADRNVSGASPHSSTLNALTITTNGTDFDSGQLYYTFFPGHTNWPLSAVGIVNNLSIVANAGNSPAFNRNLSWLMIYCVET